MNRRTFIKIAAVSLATLFTGCKKIKEVPEKILDVKFIRQIVTKDISSSRCIMWQADEPLKNPVAEVKTGSATKNFPAQEISFVDDGKKVIQYTAQIELGDEYRIVDGDATTYWYDLKKIPDDKFKAIIFPDSQCSGSYDPWGGVAGSAFAKNPDAVFFVNVGDLVDNGEDYTQWEDWLKHVAQFTPEIVFAPVLGNHETYTREWTFRTPVSYLNYFATPDNGVEKFSRRFYSFEVGAAHFAVLDSQWDELGNNVIDAQKNWLRQGLNSTDKPWKIIFIQKRREKYESPLDSINVKRYTRECGGLPRKKSVITTNDLKQNRF